MRKGIFKVVLLSSTSIKDRHNLKVVKKLSSTKFAVQHLK